MSLQAFKKRFRLNPIVGKLWFLIVGVLIICIISDLSLDGIGKWLGKIPFFAPPDYLPIPFNPFLEITLPFKEFIGVQLKDNWGILFIFVPLHIIAMLGEELMWRCYILPSFWTICAGLPISPGSRRGCSSSISTRETAPKPNGRSNICNRSWIPCAAGTRN